MTNERAPGAACVVTVTINLHGMTVERRQTSQDLLFGRHSYGRYTAAVGCSRLFPLLERHGIRATVFVPGAEAEEHPDLVADVARRGHEIAAHGYAMEEYTGRPEDEMLLERTHEILERTTGRAPRGWRAPHGHLTSQTLASLAAIGYLYDASFQDDDVPYRLDGDGGVGMIELPQNETLIDATLYGVRQPHDRVMKAWREEFDACYAERCYIGITLHPRSDYGSGRASRIEALDRFLRHVRAHPAVRFMTCEEATAAFTAGIFDRQRPTRGGQS